MRRGWWPGGSYGSLVAADSLVAATVDGSAAVVVASLVAVVVASLVAAPVLPGCVATDNPRCKDACFLRLLAGCVAHV